MDSSRVPRASRAGFTLLEILLSLALIALLSGVMIGVSSHLLRSRPTTPDEIFWHAVQAGRHQALVSSRDVRMTFDGKAKAFVLDGGAARPISFPIPAAGDLGVDFLAADSSGSSAILVGGSLISTQTLPAVVFHDDGTCTRFRVQFRAKGTAHILAVDPWTCASVLPTPKP